MHQEVSVVFCTCDAYSDLWENFFKLFRKYWPQFDGEIILNTESKPFSYPGLNISTPLNCSKDASWSERLSMASDRAKGEFLLIFLDDFYLKGPVKAQRFAETVAFMKDNPETVSITYLKEPGGFKPVKELEGFAWRKHFSLYKMTAHISLYRKAYLQKTLRDDENAWRFEVNGTVRTWFKRGDFICAQSEFEPIFDYDFGALVVRGNYVKEYKEYFEKKEGCSFNERRAVIDEIVFKPPAGVYKKMSYFIGGVLSLLKKRPKRGN